MLRRWFGRSSVPRRGARPAAPKQVASAATGTRESQARSTWGYKTGWLAIQPRIPGTVQPEQVATSLGLVDQRPAKWADGVEQASNVGAFVTPELDGWTFAMGLGILLLQSDDVVVELSRDLDAEVQWFSSHRVSDSHAWARAAGGELVRSFHYPGGEVAVDVGEPNSVEHALLKGAEVYDDEQARLFVHLNEEAVMKVAASWSINPQEIEPVIDDRTGVLGRTPWTAVTERRLGRN